MNPYSRPTRNTVLKIIGSVWLLTLLIPASASTKKLQGTATGSLAKIICEVINEDNGDQKAAEATARSFADGDGKAQGHNSIEVETQTFTGTYTPPDPPAGKAGLYRLAIFSDDGCDVILNGTTLIDNFNKGQPLPDLNKSFHVLDPLLIPGQPVDITVEYSNCRYIENGEKPDIDGCTLFVFLLPFEVRDINDHADTGDDVTITPWDTTQPIANRNIAWIDAHTSDQNPAPRMPQLEFRMPGLPQGITIEAKLEVKYERGNGARHPSRTDKDGNTDTVKIPENGDFKTDIAGDTWQIWNEYPLQAEGFFGGDATLTYRLKSGTNEILAPQTIKFRIGGENPDDARCRTYIETLPDAGPNGSLWFAYAIAKSESRDYNGQGSRYNQFLELPTHVQDVGRPLWGNDGGTTPGGYGMFQVTGDASDSTANIPRKQIWNWQDNVSAGLAILASKRTTAVAWMTQQKNANNANGTALPDHTVGIVTFSEGTARTMTHAVTIKLYNGASRAPTGFVDGGSAPGFRLDPQGSGHYCFWRNASNEWALNRFNDPPDPIQPFNYVARVCGEVEN